MFIRIKKHTTTFMKSRQSSIGKSGDAFKGGSCTMGRDDIELNGKMSGK